MCVQIAGTAGKIVEYPFDTIKVRLQSQPTTPPFLYSGPWDCFRQSVSQSSSSSSPNNHGGGRSGGDGIRGLYRGLSAPLFGAAIETSSLFFSYRLAQTLLRSSGLIVLSPPPPPPPPSASYASYASDSSSFSSSANINDEGGDDYKKKNKIVNNNSNNNNDDGSRLPLGALVACGAASGAFTSLILTPIELVKCQMQVPPPPPPPPPPLSPQPQPPLPHNTTSNISRFPAPAAAVARPPPPGPLSIIATIYRHHGPLGFWHGQLATCIRETGGSAAWFGVYEAVSALFRSRSSSSSSFSSSSFSPSSSSSESSPTTTKTTKTATGTAPLAIWQQMTAGACAGVSYIFGFFPADTIKSRMQTEAVVLDVTTPTPTAAGGGGGGGGGGRRIGAGASMKKKTKVKVTFWECARILWREQGVKGLYRGCGITVARAAPSSAFIFAIYEGLKGAF